MLIGVEPLTLPRSADARLRRANDDRELKAVKTFLADGVREVGF